MGNWGGWKKDGSGWGEGRPVAWGEEWDWTSQRSLVSLPQAPQIYVRNFTGASLSVPVRAGSGCPKHKLLGRVVLFFY